MEETNRLDDLAKKYVKQPDFCFVTCNPETGMDRLCYADSVYNLERFLAALFETKQETAMNTVAFEHTTDTESNIQKWASGLIETFGKWVVHIPPLQISRCFHNSKQAKLFIYATLKEINQKVSLSAIPQQLSKLAMGFKDSKAITNIDDVIRVAEYEEAKQDAVCIYFDRVQMASDLFPLGSGPLETIGTTHRMFLTYDWRQVFYKAWMSANKHLKTVQKKMYASSYKNHLKEYAKKHPEFHQMLCATYPLRLVYINELGKAKHAILWEIVRADYLELEIPLTEPLCDDFFMGRGCEKPAIEKPKIESKLIIVSTTDETTNLDSTDIEALDNACGFWKDLVAHKHPQKLALPCCGICPMKFKRIGDEQNDPTFQNVQEYVTKASEHVVSHGKFGYLELWQHREDWVDLWVFRAARIAEFAALKSVLHARNIQVVYFSEQGELEVDDYFTEE